MDTQFARTSFGMVSLFSVALMFGMAPLSAQDAANSAPLDLGFTVSDQVMESDETSDSSLADPERIAANPAAAGVFHADGQPLSPAPASLGTGKDFPLGEGSFDSDKNDLKDNSHAESLNSYFDTYKAGVTSNSPEETLTNGSFGNMGLMSVRDGLVPASRKSYGRFFADGWVSGSAFNENQWPVTNGFDSSAKGKNSSGSEYQMNQAYVTLGRELDYADHWDVGGRIDLLYGTDYVLASSLGLESFNHTASGAAAGNIYAAEPRWSRNKQGGYPDYGLAMPQAYAEVYAPLLTGLSVKLGHFYSPMGYESICSPNNFFYSHSYTMLYGQPQTLTGASAKLRLNEEFALVGGVHEGWNVWDDNNDKVDVMGGFVWERGANTSLSFLLMSGEAVVDNEFNRATREYSPVNGTQTNYSLVFQRRLSHELTWVLEHDLGIADDAAYYYNAQFNPVRQDGHWYSVVNYLYLSLTPKLDVGARAEWFCDQNGTRLLAGMPTAVDVAGMDYKWTGENLFDISLGLNWRPTRFMTIRPEVRWDYSDIQKTSLNGDHVLSKGIYDNFSDNNLLTFGGDIIIHF